MCESNINPVEDSIPLHDDAALHKLQKADPLTPTEVLALKIASRVYGNGRSPLSAEEVYQGLMDGSLSPSLYNTDGTP